MVNILRNKEFICTNKAKESSKLLEKKLVQALLLALFDFLKTFQVECDTLALKYRLF